LAQALLELGNMKEFPMFTKLSIAAALALGAAGAQALPFYPDPGTINPLNYSFTAAEDGDVVAYFAYDGAAFDNLLGLIVNGVDTGILGLPNNSTAPGTALNFGPVSAGDELVFYISVLNTGNFFYSDTSLNVDGITHIWATAYSDGEFGIPDGTLVGFEDILGGGDADYEDLVFVFTNVGVTSGIPEPATWGLMIAGFGLVGFASRRRRVTTISA
jgi:hypothetical protein